MLTGLQYRILKRFRPPESSEQEAALEGALKLDRYGDWLLREIPGKRVIDFGCGGGAEAVPIIDDCRQRGAGSIVAPRLLPSLLVLRLRHFEKMRDAVGCRDPRAAGSKRPGQGSAQSIDPGARLGLDANLPQE